MTFSERSWKKIDCSSRSGLWVSEYSLASLWKAS